MNSDWKHTLRNHFWYNACRMELWERRYREYRTLSVLDINLSKCCLILLMLGLEYYRELGQYHGCWWPGIARSSAAMLLIKFLCRPNKSWTFTRKDLNYLDHLSLQVITNASFVPKVNLAQYRILLPVLIRKFSKCCSIMSWELMAYPPACEWRFVHVSIIRVLVSGKGK